MTRAQKTEAENNAAEEALKTYKDTIEAMIPEFEANQEAKKIERGIKKAAKAVERGAIRAPVAEAPEKRAAEPPAKRPKLIKKVVGQALK